MDDLDLLDACQQCYGYAGITAGPDGRDGASLFRKGSNSGVAFRGTLNVGAAAFIDWLNDLRAEHVARQPFPGMIHAGFYCAFSDLQPKLPSFAFSGDEIVLVTGHSKGAALAELLAYFLASHGVRVKVVTFGGPKVGNHSFALGFWRLMEKGLIDARRYENPHDVVPRLPLLGYESCGVLVEPPETWYAPRGVLENHHLQSGYRPWVEALTRPSAPAA